MGKKYQRNPYQRKTSPSAHKTRSRTPSSKSSPPKRKYVPKSDRGENTKFMPCNSTNIQIIKDYFATISPSLYNRLANSGDYQLFQYEGYSHEIYLVPMRLSRLVKKFTKTFAISYAGVHLGYMRRKRSHTGFERAFYLSYEGGEFLYSRIHSHFQDLLSEVQTLTLSGRGEKSFLYGQNISFGDVLSDTEHLQKKKLIFVKNEQEIYLGLALLLVRQAGGVNVEAKDSKYQHEFSRSPNFTVAIINLTDAGYFLRQGK